MKKNERSRNFALVTYLSPEEVERYCKLPHVKNYAWILHDKDVKEDGTPKEPHIHLVVVYHNARTLSAVRSDFSEYKQNTMSEYCIDLEGAYDYLTHRRNPEKAQYSNDLVHTNVGYFRGDYSSSEDNTAYCLVMDIIAGKSRLELLRKYGRDYAINRAQYYGLATEIMREEEYVHNDELTLKDFENETHRATRKHRPVIFVTEDGEVDWEALDYQKN